MNNLTNDNIMYKLMFLFKHLLFEMIICLYFYRTSRKAICKR